MTTVVSEFLQEQKHLAEDLDMEVAGTPEFAADTLLRECADGMTAMIAALEGVLALHHKITRYGNDMYSISAESHEDDPSSYEDMEPFDLCAECYEVEKLICEECGGDNYIGHRSAWPCPTAAALAPVAEEGDKE